MSGDMKILFTITWFSLADPDPCPAVGVANGQTNVRRSDAVIVELVVVHLSTRRARASCSTVLRPVRGIPKARHVELNVYSEFSDPSGVDRSIAFTTTPLFRYVWPRALLLALLELGSHLWGSSSSSPAAMPQAFSSSTTPRHHPDWPDGPESEALRSAC